MELRCLQLRNKAAEGCVSEIIGEGFRGLGQQ